jgi:transposase
MTQEPQERRVIGLDVHPYMFSASALAGADALQAREIWHVDRVPLVQIEKILMKYAAKNDIVVMEAGGNSFAVAERIAKCGVTALVLESQSVGKVGKTYCATDRTDSVKIARVYLSGLAHVVWTPDSKATERREIFYAHRNAVIDCTRARNRIWGFLNQYCVRKPKGLRLSEHEKAIAVLVSLRAWTPMQVVLLKDMMTAFREAETRRTQFRQIIAEEVAGDPGVLKMIRLLGIRDRVAFALAAFIGNIDRFATPKKLTTYFGLNPKVIESGIHRSTGRISRYGRSDVRALMIQAAQSALRYGKCPVHQWAVALKMRKGANIAVTALARKMVVSVWYLLKGFFTPLTDIDTTLSTKIHKLASAIGLKRIRALGFKTVKLFEENLHAQILQTT